MINFKHKNIFEKAIQRKSNSRERKARSWDKFRVSQYSSSKTDRSFNVNTLQSLRETPKEKTQINFCFQDRSDKKQSRIKNRYSVFDQRNSRFK